MGLAEKSIIIRHLADDARGLGGHLEEEIHADGKVGSVDESDPGVEDALPDPIDLEETIEIDGPRLALAISALPGQQREAILLRYYQDLSLAEMASVLSIPIGTVKSRLSLGLRQLRLSLKDEAVCHTSMNSARN